MSKARDHYKRDPHRYDPSPRNKSAAQIRGWRTRKEAKQEPCTPMTKEELEIERLQARVAELETKVKSIEGTSD